MDTRVRKPITCHHNLGHYSFTGGTVATSFKGPQGKRGFLIDVGIRVTETFACDTTTAKVRLGSAADADLYAELIIPDGTTATDTFNTVDDRDAVKGPELPAETQVEVTFVNSADSVKAEGAGYVYAIVDWY